MASTTTFVSQSEIIRPALLDLIEDLGATCEFPPGVTASARLLLDQIKFPAAICRGSKNLLAATCLCVAARHAHHLFSLAKLASAASTNRVAINRLGLRLQNMLGIRRPPADLRLIVPQICQRIVLPERTEEVVNQLAAGIQARVLPRVRAHLTASLAAALVFAAGQATNENLTYSACARAARVSTSAVRTAWKALEALTVHKSLATPERQL